MCAANGQRRGGRDEGEGRRRKNEIVAERCRHEEEKHFNSRCLSFNACSVSLCNSVLVSRCEWEWKKWEGNQSRPVSLGSAMFFVSSCCYRWFHRELCVVALRWTSEVMKRTFKVWLQKKKEQKKKKKKQDSHHWTLSFCPPRLCLFLLFASQHPGSLALSTQ